MLPAEMKGAGLDQKEPWKHKVWDSWCLELPGRVGRAEEGPGQQETPLSPAADPGLGRGLSPADGAKRGLPPVPSGQEVPH